jgi:hypothetical protein
MKTNDVTGRYRPGYVGIAVELGRPGLGASFVDIQTVARAVARHGVAFCDKNPVTHLMVDKTTGDINPEVLGERVLSGIVEFEVLADHAPEVLETLKLVARDIDSVFSLDIINLVEPNGSVKMFQMLEAAGYAPSPNGKNNMGLGRPAYDFSQETVA